MCSTHPRSYTLTLVFGSLLQCRRAPSQVPVYTLYIPTTHPFGYQPTSTLPAFASELREPYPVRLRLFARVHSHSHSGPFVLADRLFVHQPSPYSHPSLIASGLLDKLPLDYLLPSCLFHLACWRLRQLPIHRLHADLVCDRPPSNLTSLRATKESDLLPAIDNNKQEAMAGPQESSTSSGSRKSGGRAVGQFNIGSEIGKGSFAQVYLGWHKVRQSSHPAFELLPIIAPSCVAALSPLHHPSGLSDCFWCHKSHITTPWLVPYRPIANKRGNRRPRLLSLSNPSSLNA